MKKIIRHGLLFCILIILFLCISGCTTQYLTKDLGGEMTIELAPGYKLVEITWKEANLWYLVRPFEDGETATTYYFQESSEFGVFQGTVKIIEKEAEK